MGTNRYHFSFIPKEHHIKSVSTSFQYFIKHEDIVKHVRFKQLRAEKGSIFAFHGSPQENWHAILRSGLQIGKGGYLVSRKTKFENKNKIICFILAKRCCIWCRHLCLTKLSIFSRIYKKSSFILSS